MKFSTALAPRGSRPGGSGGRRRPVRRRCTGGVTGGTGSTPPGCHGRAAQQPPYGEPVPRSSPWTCSASTRRRCRSGRSGRSAAGRGRSSAGSRGAAPIERPGRAARRRAPCAGPAVTTGPPGPAQDRPQAGVEVVAELRRRGASAAGGSARTTSRAPGGRLASRGRTRWRSRRATRWRTTEPPTALLTTKPARGGASAGPERRTGIEVHDQPGPADRVGPGGWPRRTRPGG